MLRSAASVIPMMAAKPSRPSIGSVDKINEVRISNIATRKVDDSFCNANVDDKHIYIGNMMLRPASMGTFKFLHRCMVHIL